MKKIFLPALAAIMLTAGCSKSDTPPATTDFNATEDATISDFVNKVAMPAYADLQAKGEALNTAVVNLNASTTDANLATAKQAWKDMRGTWEKCEGFLFGPVDQDEYDPETDTWPVNFNDMDALLASSQPLTPSAVAALPSRALKGYHPIEYMLWGKLGNKTASQFTAREKEYLVSLSAHLKSNADALYSSWVPAEGNYANSFLKAGIGSTEYVKKQDAILALVDGLESICGEVGDGKMKEPFDALNPNIVESPFSGNSTTDFKNNITGAFNVYLGRFNADGTGLEDLVKAKNTALDVELQQKFNAAITSFNNITLPFEQAIITQRAQVQNTMTAVNSLSETISTKLRPFVIQYVTN